jgi:hypothetical protein
LSVRAEVRFTRDVDIAVAVGDDAEAEALVHGLGARGYGAVATVEHETRSGHRLDVGARSRRLPSSWMRRSLWKLTPK